ncbi:amidase signature domain-containing protein [Aspergillus cavernicola]|uniref:Amidase signature domain-containing protein n=1 Tax=Aspergillus cavernicola TaxID=176166 RepID=A0ABR4IEA0_9EURO
MAAKFSISILILTVTLFVSTLTLVDSTYDMWKLSELFPRHPARWQQVASEKREANLAKIPPEWILEPQLLEDGRSRHSIVGDYIEGLLDAKSQYITDMDVPELVARMQEGILTAVEVVTAFCKRAAYAHQLSNLLLEVRFNEAIERARELDNYFKEHKQLVGPLHGIPLTLKDQFHIKGLDTSMGFIGWIGTFEGEKGTGKEKNVESELIREFNILGAVPIGKTTLMQSLWAPETNNNILGYAFNPCNRDLSTGGSSGGEGAMQALRGSAFGIGTDIGGSVSMPASFQGVFSIKPSAGRISFKDAANTGKGQEVMPTVVGIMGHSVDSLRLILKSLISTQPWLNDPYTLQIPWRFEKEYDPRGELGYKPAFGFLADDGVLTPHPPVSRAMEIVKEALQIKGHQLIEWDWPHNNETTEIHASIARGDGCPDVYDAVHLSGEPFVPEITNLFPNGKPRDPLPLPEYEEVVRRMKDYRERYLNYWTSTAERTGDRPVEVLLSPVTPYAGVLPGKYQPSTYTSSVNVLDYASVVIPVTLADKTIDIVSPSFKSLNEEDQINMMSYDPDKHHGAPAAVQLIGRRLDEERLLSLAQVVVESLNDYRSEHEKKGRS